MVFTNLAVDPIEVNAPLVQHMNRLFGSGKLFQVIHLLVHSCSLRIGREEWGEVSMWNGGYTQFGMYLGGDSTGDERMDVFTQGEHVRSDQLAKETRDGLFPIGVGACLAQRLCSHIE